MATSKAYYRVVKVRKMPGRRTMVLVVERIEKPIFPKTP